MRGVEHESEGVTEELNRSCRCVAVDAGALAGALESGAGTEGLYASILRDQPHLFSASAVFLSRRHLERMQEAVAAITRVVAMPAFQEAALAAAPAAEVEGDVEPEPSGESLLDRIDSLIKISTYNAEKRTWQPEKAEFSAAVLEDCLLYTSPSPRDVEETRMPSSA